MISVSSFRWFLVLLVPFIIGTIVHFLIPLNILLYCAPLSQKVYALNQVKSKQIVYQSQAILAAAMVSSMFNRFQIIRSVLTSHLQSQSIFHQTQTQSLKLLYQNQKEACQQNIYQSIVSAPNINSLQLLSEQQHNIYKIYKNFEPFIRSAFITSKQMVGIETIVQTNNELLVLNFPCNEQSNYSKVYQKSLKQWKSNEKIERTVFSYNNLVYSCTMNRFSNTTIATICVKTTLLKLVQNIKIVFNQKFRHSNQQYYLLTPLQSINESFVLMKFTNFDQIVKFPEEQTFLRPNQINRQLLKPTISPFQIYSFQLNSTTTYTLVPIKIKSVLNLKKITVLYIFIETTFIENTLANVQLRPKTLSIIVPSILSLIVIFLTISVCIIKCLYQDLNTSINILNEHCTYLINQSLDVKIPKYEETEDLRWLFQLLGTINQLHQTSSKTFFSGPSPEKLLRYFSVLKLYQRLQYDTTSLLEIMGNCCFNMKDITEAAYYYTRSINLTIEKIELKYGAIKNIVTLKKKRKELLDNHYYQLERSLKLKLYKKYICLLYTTNITTQNLQLEQLVYLYRKAAYPNKDNSEYIMVSLMEIRYLMLINNIQSATSALKKIKPLLNKYKLSEPKLGLQYWTQSFIQHQVVETYYHFIKALYCISIEKYPQSLKFYIKTLQSNIFSVEVHRAVKANLMKFLKQHNLLNQSLLSTCYLAPINKESQSQFVMMFDWTQDIKCPKKKKKENSKKLIELGFDIFDKYIGPLDRLSVLKFDQDAEIICTLTMKHPNEKLIAMEFKNLIKIKTSNYKADFTQSLVSSINRIKHLCCKKIIISYLRENTCLDIQSIEKIMKNNKNILLIVIKMKKQIEQKSNFFYIFDIEDEQSLKRILMQKGQIIYKTSVKFL